jgi:hypothetical protein
MYLTQSDDALGIEPGTTSAVDPYSAFPIAGDAGAAAGTGTGQHGVAPLTGNGGSMGGAVNSVWSWLNEPFTTPLSMIDVFLLVGTILIAIIMWNLILYHIRIAGETL